MTKRKSRLRKAKRKSRPAKQKLRGIIIKRRKKALGDVRLQQALTTLRDTKDLRSAAKAARTTPIKFKREAISRKLIKRRGNAWFVSRDLHREMSIFSEGRTISIKLRTRSAQLAGKYMSAVGAFLRSNNIRILDQFIDRGVKDIAGKRHVFETNPNTLYRLASSTDDAFEQIYRIVLD